MNDIVQRSEANLAEIRPKRPKFGGRQVGTRNKLTVEFRETVRMLLESNAENVGKWLDEVATGAHGDPDPGKALDLLVKLAEFAAPKLGRIEVTGDAKAPLQVVGMTLGEFKAAAAEIAAKV